MVKITKGIQGLDTIYESLHSEGYVLIMIENWTINWNVYDEHTKYVTNNTTKP